MGGLSRHQQRQAMRLDVQVHFDRPTRQSAPAPVLNETEFPPPQATAMSGAQDRNTSAPRETVQRVQDKNKRKKQAGFGAKLSNATDAATSSAIAPVEPQTASSSAPPMAVQEDTILAITKDEKIQTYEDIISHVSSFA